MPSHQYKVGVIFRPLDALRGSSASVASALPTNPGNLSGAALTHWIIVFSTASSSRLVELIEHNRKITYKVRDASHKVRAHYFGTYTGHLEDVARLAKSHPMNGRMYNEVSNNCQHWAAHLLGSLCDLAKSSSHRHFGITDKQTWTAVIHVVKNKGHGAHVPNEFVSGVMHLLQELIH
ncbi:hypothetical protein FRC14_004750 [Serendipita sp. 396]|nr:hypothetical protein FRC14_004750 [Serendipita sp. 396]KAG8789369.1 hypothetical protein FRC15_009421 [Serendipita sp. 397]KAG8804601.1 hypothetical protein FRC16_006043 [Serendipita sp. 398]KAG8848003.1 hypothetical protein FRB91_011238 [Serendipita sp. 411]KAG8878723.1 hypothetical protein FRC20_006400 [Serendipita sp. 405]KAG9056675.1 hypothetical protein FS842_009912 [Serendipita sp. 407]